MNRRSVLWVGMLLLAWAGTQAEIFASGQKAGSILIFPYYDTHATSLQIITITNTNGDASANPETGLLNGTIDIMFIYIDSEECFPSDRVERLTPYDTFTFVPSEHLFNDDEAGFLYVYAIDSDSGRPVAFDYLIGTELIFDSAKQSVVNLNPIAISAGRDGPSDDHMLHLDGLEYECLADVILIPRFFGQGEGMSFTSPFHSALLFINFTGGAHFMAQAKMLIMNDNEQAFSATVTFPCWTIKELAEISGATHLDFLEGTNHDPDEVSMGAVLMETGWIVMQGDFAYNPNGGNGFIDPAFFAIQLEENIYTNMVSANLPYEIGIQDNGLLWSTSVDGK